MVREEHLLAREEPVEHLESAPLSQVLENLCRICGLDIGRVWYVDHHREVLRMGEYWGNVSDPWREVLHHGRLLTLSCSKGLVGRSLEARTPLWIADVSKEPTYSESVPTGEYGAMAFPVITQNSVIGVIEIVGHALHEPTDGFLKWVSALSEQMGFLIVACYPQHQNFPEPVMEAPVCIQKGLAHDLNNILTVISGFAEMGMMNVESSNPVSSYFIQVQTAVSRGQHLVRQILEAPTESCQERKSFILGPIICEVLENIRGSLSSEIEIQEHLPAYAARMVGNSDELYYVVMNICSNAVQAMKKGGKLIVALEELVTGDEIIPLSSHHACCSWIQLSVRETGIGLSQEIVDQIFDPVVTTRKDQGGTDLGLTIVQRIVSAHSGILSVESMPGLGAYVSIFLPRSLSDL